MVERYGLTLVTAPASEPVTLAEAKAWLRQDHAADDARIERHVAAAREWIERATGLLLVTQTWRLTLDDFPEWEVALGTPLLSVSSITYADPADGSTETLAATEYEIDETVKPGIVQPSYGNVWPAARCQAKSVQITFVAGYGAASAVPSAVKDAVCVLAASLYDHDAMTPEAQTAALALLAPFCDGRYP